VIDCCRILPYVKSLIRDAGAAVIDIYNRDFLISKKSDESFITEADLCSEAIIINALSHIIPDIPIVSEESMSRGMKVDVSDGRFWLVDPLDGTNEFIKHSNEFTINIGLIWDGEPCLGVLYVPIFDLLFSGIPGSATLEEQKGLSTVISCRSVPCNGITVLSSRDFHDSNKFDNFIKQFNVTKILNLGSSLKFALIAMGKADLYPRFGQTMEWDTAAAHAILKAAGGSICLFDGAQLFYGKPKFNNPPFVACGIPTSYICNLN
jgi:3'(2'), 5'-bisphosphate nucleotidase